jgi:UDP-GlcNAc:undecaprenyl-phosphate GlcNAc-1-phosphate transferase
VITGAVVAYLAFNLRLPWRKRARIFLGNSGSAYLGLIIAWAVFRLTQNPVYPVTPILAPFLIAPPLIDCLVLIVRRLLHKRSPFHADRTHAHHLMLDGGFSVTGVVITLCVLSLSLGLGVALALRADVPQPVLLAVFAGLAASRARHRRLRQADRQEILEAERRFQRRRHPLDIAVVHGRIQWQAEAAVVPGSRTG